MKYILLLFLSLFVTSLPIISFSQVDHPSYPTITQQIPSIDKQSQPGYLILATNIINDSGGTKLASDFTINIVGNSFILASFQALPAPEIKIVSMQEGQYSMSISNSQGYKISQQNQCEGQIKSGEVKTCLITLDDEATATAPFPPPQTGGGGGQQTPPAPSPPPQTGGGGGQQTPPAPSPPPQTGGGGGSSTLPPGSPFHFTTAGDFRYNAETDTNLAANNPDIIVLLGDYSYNGGAQNWWTKNMEAINGKKVIGVVGNHDSPEDDFLALFPENGGKWEYIYKVSNVAFVAFDTENNDPSTLDPLLQQAQADPTVAHIIPFGHKTVFTPTANPLTPDADDGYFDVFKKYDKIRMILGGHNHFYARMNAVPETSFIYVTVGNGGANPHKDSGESGSPPQQYVRSNGGLHCYVNNDTISCRMISNEGKVWDEFTIKPGNPPQSSQDPEQAPAGKDSDQRAITQQIPSTITQQIPSTITQQIPSIAKQLQPGFLSNKYY